MSENHETKRGGSPHSRLQSVWENLEMWIGIVTVSLVVVIAFAQVVARYVVGQSLQWAEEVCKFGIIWMTFGGAAYSFRMGANIGVTFFVDHLPKNVAKVLAVLVHIVLIGCFVLLFVVGGERMMDQIAKNQVSTAARLPMWIPWLSIPFGSALTVARLIQQLISMLRNLRGQAPAEQTDAERTGENA